MTHQCSHPTFVEIGGIAARRLVIAGPEALASRERWHLGDRPVGHHKCPVKTQETFMQVANFASGQSGIRSSVLEKSNPLDDAIGAMRR